MALVKRFHFRMPPTTPPQRVIPLGRLALVNAWLPWVSRKPRPEAFEAVARAAKGDRPYGLLKDLNQTLGELAKETGITPLLEATERNDLATVEWCLAQQCDPDATRTKDGKTALHLAAGPRVSPDIMASLLSSKASVDVGDKYARSPLFTLAENYDSFCTTFYPNAGGNLIKKATLLLDAGADPNKSSRLGARPLKCAIENKQSTLAKLLLDRGANPNVVDSGFFGIISFITGDRKSALDVLRETGDSALAADLAPHFQGGRGRKKHR